MAKIARIGKQVAPAAAQPVRARQSRPSDLSGFSAADRAFIDKTLAGYAMRGRGKGHKQKSIDATVKTMTEYFAFSGLGPWNWTEDSFDQWNDYLATERRVTRKTQSTYQKNFTSYQNYVVSNSALQTQCRIKFGEAIVEIANRYNCVPHKNALESETGRRPYSAQEQKLLLKTIKKKYELCVQSANKGRYAAARDYVMWQLLFDAGIRVDELLGIEVYHFDEHPKFPKCGGFGRVSVWGKSSKGGPKKMRVVTIENPKLAALLKWYFEHIRPLALLKASAQEQAFWLNERGTRLKYKGFWQTFDGYRTEAGLEKRGLVIHSTRHTSITRDLSNNVPSVAVQQKHGHQNLGTTGGYCAVSDPYVDEQYRRSALQKRRNQLLQDAPPTKK